ncbi:MAG: class I SAM-dependent methyltransferase [Rudaea sp.]
MQNATAPRDHFSRITARWSHFGPPLRPSQGDTAVVQRVVAGLGTAARAVVLGLTPEVIGCDWPADVRLFAVDHSPKMIEALWPPARGPANAEVILADWCAMPIAPGSIDLVAGDGCYVLLAYPDGYENLTRAVCSVLRPGGQFVIRVFLRPDLPESVADIARAVAAGEVGSVHALKLRLLAALHGMSGAGSRLDDVWQTWKSMPPLPATLAGLRGWTEDEITGIESYRDMHARYYLPTLAEFRQITTTLFHEIECAFGVHELGDRCPTFVLGKKGTE